MPFLRANVVTPTLTYVAHSLEISDNDGPKVAKLFDRRTGEQVGIELTEVEYTSPDGQLWYLSGVDPDGVPTKWRAVRGCACSAPRVYPTPEYDRP